MAFSIETVAEDEQHAALVLTLEGQVTARHAVELHRQLLAAMAENAAATLRVKASAVTDIDSAILQLLCSLRKTARSFEIEEPAQAFNIAADRCALRRELMGNGSREG